MNQKPKVIVCQHGARRRYAVPRMLEQAEMLAALYTDSSEYSFLGSLAKVCKPFWKGKILKLANRRISGIPSSKIYSTDFFTYYKCLVNILPYCKKRTEKLWFWALSYTMKRWGIRDNSIIYNMYCENYDFLKYAREMNAKIIVDVYISPLYQNIIMPEYSRFGIENSWPRKFDDVSFSRIAATMSIADILLCPSDWVADGIRELCPLQAHKIRMCPYGSSINYNGNTNKPITGRIFWAGGDWIRKGLYYLAQAADRLKAKYPEMDFRAAGITDPEVITASRFKNINFLGRLDAAQMQKEFLSADMFVLPTLAEGMVGTGIEAIAAGCPVITTEEAGIDAIENGKSGIIIPTRNSEAVAKAIERLFLDRELRDSMSRESVRLAELYTEEAWGRRLVNLIKEMA